MLSFYLHEASFYFDFNCTREIIYFSAEQKNRNHKTKGEKTVNLVSTQEHDHQVCHVMLITFDFYL